MLMKNLRAIAPRDDEYFDIQFRRRRRNYDFYNYYGNNNLSNSNNLIFPKIRSNSDNKKETDDYINTVSYDGTLPPIVSFHPLSKFEMEKKRKRYFKKHYLISYKYLRLYEDDEAEHYYSDDDISTTEIGYIQNKNKIKKSDSDVYTISETLEYLDSIPNNYLKNVATFIMNNIEKITRKETVVVPPKLIIHKVFLELILNNVFHKIEIRNQLNQVISIENVINLLHEEIENFQRNNYHLKKKSKNSKRSRRNQHSTNVYSSSDSNGNDVDVSGIIHSGIKGKKLSEKRTNKYSDNSSNENSLIHNSNILIGKKKKYINDNNISVLKQSDLSGYTKINEKATDTTVNTNRRGYDHQGSDSSEEKYIRKNNKDNIILEKTDENFTATFRNNQKNSDNQEEDDVKLTSRYKDASTECKKEDSTKGIIGIDQDDNIIKDNKINKGSYKNSIQSSRNESEIRNNLAGDSQGGSEPKREKIKEDKKGKGNILKGIEYDKEGKPIIYDREGRPIQYDKEGRPILYDEKGRQLQYDKDGKLFVVDKDGKKIYYEKEIVIYDKEGKPLIIGKEGKIVLPLKDQLELLNKEVKTNEQLSNEMKVVNKEYKEIIPKKKKSNEEDEMSEEEDEQEGTKKIGKKKKKSSNKKRTKKKSNNNLQEEDSEESDENSDEEEEEGEEEEEESESEEGEGDVQGEGKEFNTISSGKQSKKSKGSKKGKGKGKGKKKSRNEQEEVVQQHSSKKKKKEKTKTSDNQEKNVDTPETHEIVNNKKPRKSKVVKDIKKKDDNSEIEEEEIKKNKKSIKVQDVKEINVIKEEDEIIDPQKLMKEEMERNKRELAAIKEAKQKKILNQKEMERMRIENEQKLENEKKVKEYLEEMKKHELTKSGVNNNTSLNSSNSSKTGGTKEHNDILRKLLLKNNPNFFSEYQPEEEEAVPPIKRNNQQQGTTQSQEKKKTFKMGSSPKKANLIYDNSYLFEKKQSKIFNFDTDSNNRGEESSSNLPQITSPRPSGVHQLTLDKKHRFKNPRKFTKSILQKKNYNFFQEDPINKILREKHEIKQEVTENSEDEEEEKKKKSKRTDEMLKEFFEKINMLKNASPEEYSKEMAKLIDNQIETSDFAIVKKRENRMNAFVENLNTFRQQKKTHRALKEGNLRFITPYEFFFENEKNN